MDKINFQTIPHSEQRYPTVGDYWLDDAGVYQVRVSKMSDWRYDFLVFFHEIFELAWVTWKKIPIALIDEFDKNYEANRKEGDESEPGDDIKAPYYWGHQFATALEKVAATFLMVDWNAYNEEVINLE